MDWRHVMPPQSTCTAIGCVTLGFFLVYFISLHFPSGSRPLYSNVLRSQHAPPSLATTSCQQTSQAWHATGVCVCGRVFLLGHSLDKTLSFDFSVKLSPYQNLNYLALQLRLEYLPHAQLKSALNLKAAAAKGGSKSLGDKWGVIRVRSKYYPKLKLQSHHTPHPKHSVMCITALK